MKKTLILLLALTGLSINSQSQHFVASFGVTHNWGVPAYVNHVVYDDYYDYNWVHASRVIRGGRVFFDVILQRGDVFVQLNIGRGGFIHRTRYFDYYPLHNHICGNTCGYHTNYYNTYYRTCHSHHHHGHNHVVYRRRPVYVYDDRNGRPYRQGKYVKPHKHRVEHSDRRNNPINRRVTHASSESQHRVSHRNNGPYDRNERLDRGGRSVRENNTYSERRGRRATGGR